MEQGNRQSKAPDEAGESASSATSDTQHGAAGMRDEDDTAPAHIPFWRVVLSVIQASFGVQNARNRERDFGSRSVWPFVVAALLFTVLFVLALMLVVNLVLPD